MLNFLNRTISWSFYLFFLLIPIIFTNNTSELFEFNKMWLTFGLTIVIISAWLIKMIFEGRFRVQRTVLDIPILLFLLSQFLSTIFSLDPHTSFWGYYSRFNGGFLSLITYVLLYYAFVSNIAKKRVFFFLAVSIFSGIFVALWGLPAHFGYDPTCLLFRGTFDVSCWTSAFQPKVRIFSTLGQPDWLSAYLGALIPIAIGVAMYLWNQKKKFFAFGALASVALFYIDFLFAKSRGGFVGLVAGILFFAIWYLWTEKPWYNFKLLKSKFIFPVSILLLILISFIIGTSVTQLDKFTLPSIINIIQERSQTHTVSKPATPTSPVASAGELGGTDSGKIRLFVWSGALQVWLHYPIFGTGVETFAYAYYLFMPPGHNLTSEFGYLYNKAHNEYLNYLATTGTVGLLTYLSMIAVFLWVAGKKLFSRQGQENEQTANTNILVAALLASYIDILVTNFFGFSVVIINLFLFLIPAWVLLLQGKIQAKNLLVFPKDETSGNEQASSFQWVLSGGILLVAVYFLYTLFIFWKADTRYGLGQNLVNAGDFQTAYQPLHEAIQLRPGEPVFQDELSLDDAVLAGALFTQDKTASQTAQQLSQEALAVSDNLVSMHPNVVTYWKTRVRVLYALSQIDPKYMNDALIAIEKAAELAPTDAKVSYNLGLIEGQTGHIPEAIATLNKTIQLKKDYRDAYYALGLFYHSAGVDKNGVIINAEYAQKAVEQMHFILDNFNPKDEQALAALKAWGTE